jgi:type I restriction enzyme S subunit
MMVKTDSIKLGEVCGLQNGFAFKSKDYVSVGYRVIRIANVQQGRIIGKLPKFISETKAKKNERFIMDEDDLLISLTGDVGRVGRIKEHLLPAVLNQRVARVVDLNESKIYKDYFFYFLNSSFFEDLVIDSAEGAAQKNTSTKKILSIQVPVPSLVEQKRLVAILDEAFEAIDKAKENTEKNLQNAQEIFDSYSDGVFENPEKGWESKRIGEILKLEYGKPLPKSERVLEGGYPAYGANGEKCRSASYFFSRPSIVVGRKGSAGELTLVKEKFWPLDVTYYVTFNDTHYDLYFLYYLLKSKSLPQLAKGVKPGINRNEVYSLSIQVPGSLEEQKSVVSILDEFSKNSQKLQSLYNQKLSLFYQLKQSLLQKAFFGEL